LVDQINNQTLKGGCVADLVLGVVVDPAERAGPLAELVEDLIIDVLELLRIGVKQGLPAKMRRHDDLPAAQLPFGPLVRHLEEEQQGELIDIVDRGNPIVSQHMAVTPQLINKLTCVGGFGGHGMLS
jgi:hypothetical protein